MDASPNASAQLPQDEGIVTHPTWDWLTGKKTYLLLALGALAVIGHRLGVPLPPGILIDDGAILINLWLLLLGAAARHAVGDRDEQGDRGVSFRVSRRGTN